jgi:hypothetical protein
MLITSLFVRSSFLLKFILLSTNVDYPIVDEQTNNEVINIGGQHYNLK